MIHIGFTGTRHGMTEAQRLKLYDLLDNVYKDTGWVFHHGDCLGADAEFHVAARTFGGHVVGHIPKDNKLRAYCHVDESRTPLSYSGRNQAIVDASDVVFACPFEMVPKARSGTWQTIRMAKQAGKELVVIFPDGSTEETKAR